MEMITYPRKHSEAEIQALLWYFLRKRKIDARLQVTGYSGVSGKKSLKMDLVVFVDKIAKCIVECKSWSNGYARTAIYRTNNSKQIGKYKAMYGLPVLVCARMNFVVPIIAQIQKIIATANRVV